MGCFDCTCAFTRTSIHAGDKVLIVAMQPQKWHSHHTYHMLYDLDREFGVAESSDKFNEEVGGKLFRKIAFGVYNDYGSIEGFDNNAGLEDEKGNWWDYQFLVHKKVVEGLVKNPMPSPKLVLDLLKIAFDARIQVMGNDLLGTQYYDREEVELQRKVLALTNKILDSKQKQLEEQNDWEPEQEDWDEDEE